VQPVLHSSPALNSSSNSSRRLNREDMIRSGALVELDKEGQPRPSASPLDLNGSRLLREGQIAAVGPRNTVGVAQAASSVGDSCRSPWSTPKVLRSPGPFPLRTAPASSATLESSTGVAARLRQQLEEVEARKPYPAISRGRVSLGKEASDGVARIRSPLPATTAATNLLENKELEDLRSQTAALQAELDASLEANARLQAKIDNHTLERYQLQAELDARTLERDGLQVVVKSSSPGHKQNGDMSGGRQEAVETELETQRAEVQELRVSLAECRLELRTSEAARRAAVAEAEANAEAAAAAIEALDSKPVAERASPSQKERALSAAVASSSLPIQDIEQLFQAVVRGDVDTLKAALDQRGGGSQFVLEVLGKARNAEGLTLLHTAVAGGEASAHVAKFLIEQGQRWAQQRKHALELQAELLQRELCSLIDAQDLQGRSPLSRLCGVPDGSQELVMALVEAQADPLHRDLEGRTPFITSAAAGNAMLTRVLLAITKGYVLLDADHQHRTALHWAAQEGQLSTIEVLLKAGADAKMVDIDGRTPQETALAAGHTAAAALLGEDSTARTAAAGEEAEAEGQSSSKPSEVGEVVGLDDEGLEVRNGVSL